jgi:hypothetical protein
MNSLLPEGIPEIVDNAKGVAGHVPCQTKDTPAAGAGVSADKAAS